MKIAFIGSTADLEAVHRLGSIDMALTHLFLENKSYADYFRAMMDTQREWILDNSIMELGDALAGETVLSVAKEFQPTYVVAPDSFNNKKETIARTAAFIRDKQKEVSLWGVKTMAVAHGKDWDDWRDCFIQHQNNGKVVIIGIPYGTTFEIPGVDYRDKQSKTLWMMDNRLAMTAWIAKNIRKPKQCHLLGASEPRELLWQKNHDFIYSHDSSSAYACGIHAVTLDPDLGLAREKFKMNFKDAATPEQMSRIKKNCATILSWAK